jgi:thiol-disulfide isomerase/thioredoxin
MRKSLALFFTAFAFISCVSSGGTAKEHYRVTLIEKYDTACGACGIMEPIIVQLEKKYGKSVNFLRYDVVKPADYDAGKSYITDRIPAFIFLDRDGREYYRYIGIMNAGQIEDKFREKGANPDM